MENKEHKMKCVGGCDISEEAPRPVRRARIVALVIALVLALAFIIWALVNPASAQAETANEINAQQLPDSSFIYDTSIADLNAADSYFNNQTVQVTGEVVGDRLRAGFDDEHCWVTLTSTKKGDGSTVSVFMTYEQAELIDTFGKYGMTGTVLQVKGTFHLVCNEHTGETDLHADTVSVAATGKQHQLPFNSQAFIPGLVAVTIGLVMMFLLWRAQERRR
ncbi:MAG: hydrolase [Eggerthellaceae bacterium]